MVTIQLSASATFLKCIKCGHQIYPTARRVWLLIHLGCCRSDWLVSTVAYKLIHSLIVIWEEFEYIRAVQEDGVSHIRMVQHWSNKLLFLIKQCVSGDTWVQSGHIITANGPPQLLLDKLTTMRGRWRHPLQSHGISTAAWWCVVDGRKWSEEAMVRTLGKST